MQHTDKQNGSSKRGKELFSHWPGSLKYSPTDKLVRGRQHQAHVKVRQPEVTSCTLSATRQNAFIRSSEELSVMLAMQQGARLRISCGALSKSVVWVED